MMGFWKILLLRKEAGAACGIRTRVDRFEGPGSCSARRRRRSFFDLERAAGIEPATDGLEDRDSASELYPHELTELGERLFGWHQRKDLNPDERSWRPPCCRYITLAYHREELNHDLSFYRCVAVVPRDDLNARPAG